MDRGELTPSTDPAGLRAKRQLTTTHRQIQKDLRDHSAPPTEHRWVSERAEKKVQRQRFVLIPFIVLTPRFPQTLCSDRAGQALGAGAGPQAGSPELGQGSHLARGS